MKSLEPIVWQFTDQRGVVLHEYTVTRTVWHLADGTFRTTALGSRGRRTVTRDSSGRFVACGGVQMDPLARPKEAL